MLEQHKLTQTLPSNIMEVHNYDVFYLPEHEMVSRVRKGVIEEMKKEEEKKEDKEEEKVDTSPSSSPSSTSPSIVSPAASERLYDVVTCTEAAEHFYHPLQEFLTIDRITAPSAYVALMTEFAEPHNFFARHHSYLKAAAEQNVKLADLKFSEAEIGSGFTKWSYIRDPTHVCLFRRKTMEWLGEKMGWKMVFCDDERVVIFQKQGKGTAER